MRRVVTLPALRILVLLAGFGMAIFPGGTRAADTDQPPLTMEELEVRGYREQPERLYLPVPLGIRHASPVRYDLLLEDVTRPILPWEIEIRNHFAGGNRDHP